jgi:hypothetical protein
MKWFFFEDFFLGFDYGSGTDFLSIIGGTAGG